MDISEETFIANLGIHIRQLREKKGLSQQDLADDCGIPRNQIGRIERGEINTTIISLYKICNALEINIKDLF